MLRPRVRAAAALAVLAGLLVTLADIAVTPSPAGAGPTTFHPIAPARVADTRTGLGGGSLGARASRAFTVAGTSGVPANAAAVALNVTVTEPTSAGYLTVWPEGLPEPSTSNLNFVAGQTVANAVFTGVGRGGAVRILNALGTTHVVVDVTGWFDAGGFTPMSPVRIVDTRSSTGGRTLGPGGRLDVPVAGAGAVVPAGAAAVAVNVTATEVSAGGYLTVWPAGGARPETSNVNMVAGQTVPSLVVSGLGTGGALSIENFAGATDVVVDVFGWFGTGGGFTPVRPARVLDTRARWCGVTLQPYEARTLPVTGHVQVPAHVTGGVVLSVTVVDASENGYLTVWPTGQPRPATSSVNPVPGRAVPNLVAVGVGAGGQVSIANGPGRTEVIVDLTGWFDGATPPGVAQPCPGAPSVPSVDPVRSDRSLRLETFATLPAGAGRRMMKLTAADSSGRTYLGVQEGQIWSIDPDGDVGTDPFLDLATALPEAVRVTPTPSALLTYFAFHPDYANSGRPGTGRLYTAHRERVRPGAAFSMAAITDLPPDFTVATQHVIAEWRVRSDDPTRVDPASYREVLRTEVYDASGGPHGIGELTFDPFAGPGSADRGILYVAVGDGNSGPNDTFSPWAQRMDNPFGKILRFDPLESGGASLRIPTDNPFVGGAGAAPLVWAYGFRNPQTLGWGRRTDGGVHLIAADIGQNAYDELHVVGRGANHGWPSLEGLVRFDPRTPPAPPGPLVAPAVVLDRDWPSNAMAAPAPIAGGAMAVITTDAYRGARAPALRGEVIYADLVQGRVFHNSLDALLGGGPLATPRELLVRVDGTEVNVVDLVNPTGTRADMRFGVDATGELYLLNKYDGIVRRVSGA